MKYEDRVQIATPEGVELEMALAGIGSRLAARLIDLAITFGGLLLVYLIVGLSLDDGDTSEAAVTIVAIVLSFLAIWGYDVLFETFNSGRTPGKKMLGIRVVGDQGEPESFTMSAVRNIIRPIDLVLVGLIAIVASKRNQRVGDMAAGTLVVKDRSVSVKDKRKTAPTSDPVKLELAQSWDLSGVSAEEYSAIRRFIDRRDAIAPRARADIAHDLASRMRPKVVNSDQVGADEHFLELVAAVKSGR